MTVLLDTVTFIWALQQPSKLSARARSIIETEANELFLSAISAYEIAVKVGIGRLKLPAKPAAYVQAGRASLGIASLPIDEDAALTVARLPAFHSDPFDRLIVAQSIVQGSAVLTPDASIAQYPARVIW